MMEILDSLNLPPIVKDHFREEKVQCYKSNLNHIHIALVILAILIVVIRPVHMIVPRYIVSSISVLDKSIVMVQLQKKCLN